MTFCVKDQMTFDLKIAQKEALYRKREDKTRKNKIYYSVKAI